MPSPFQVLKNRRKKHVRELRPRIEGFDREYRELVEKYGVEYVSVLEVGRNGEKSAELIIQEKSS